MTPVVVVLILALLLFVMLKHWSRRERTSLGIGSAAIVAADDSELAAPTLRSARFGLVGRPDHETRAQLALHAFRLAAANQKSCTVFAQGLGVGRDISLGEVKP